MHDIHNYQIHIIQNLIAVMHFLEQTFKLSGIKMTLSSNRLASSAWPVNKIVLV